MQYQDFGQLDGPIVLFGGPYSNLSALRALIDVIGDRAAICTGDVVGYCAEPNETTSLYTEQSFFGIAGNCERELVAGTEDCGCGFEKGSTCNALSAAWWGWLAKVASIDTISQLAGLPDIATFAHAGKRYAVIHGGATSINRFIWPSSEIDVFQEEFDAVEAVVGSVDGVIAGHSGIAFQRVINGKQWINAGAIGMPPHDARPETRYAILENGDVVFHRLEYDAEGTRRAMESAGLTQGYHETLTSGIWPSEDVLPAALRR